MADPAYWDPLPRRLAMYSDKDEVVPAGGSAPFKVGALRTSKAGIPGIHPREDEATEPGPLVFS